MNFIPFEFSQTILFPRIVSGFCCHYNDFSCRELHELPRIIFATDYRDFHRLRQYFTANRQIIVIPISFLSQIKKRLCTKQRNNPDLINLLNRNLTYLFVYCNSNPFQTFLNFIKFFLNPFQTI